MRPSEPDQDIPNNDDAKALAEFAELLDLLGIEAGERVSICSRKPGGNFGHMTPRARADAVALALSAPYADRDVWFSVNPVDVPAEYHGRGGDEHVTRCVALFADIDIKRGGVGDAQAAETVTKEIAAALCQPPGAVVFSGNGGHTYWTLDPDDDAWTLDTDAKRVAAQVVYRRFHRLCADIASRFGGNVDNVGQLSRILRVPGTHNLKDPADPVRVKLHAYPFGTGGPLSFAEVAEALDAYGVPEVAEDSERVGAVVSEPAGWEFGEYTTPYVAVMIDSWRDDPPRDGVTRHNGLVSQATRLACAQRLGRITETDYQQAVETLRERFEYLLTHTGERRQPTPGEVDGALAWGVGRAASMTDDRAAEEIGGALDDLALADDLDADAGRGAQGDGDADDQACGVGPGGLFVDIAAALDGGGAPKAVPALLPRSDGKCLFYKGKVNLLFGDPETAKTWIALAAGADVLRQGGRFVFIDMDHNGVDTTLERLHMLGVDYAVLADPSRFLYLEPEDKAQLCAAVDHLKGWEPDMVLMDSVGELLPLMGANSNSNDEVTAAFRAVVGPLAKAGAAVVLIDHLAKNAESRRLGPVGAYGKTRIFNGVMVRVFRVVQLAPGQGGTSSLWVHKDRTGAVRRETVAPESSEDGDDAGEIKRDNLRRWGVFTVTSNPVLDRGKPVLDEDGYPLETLSWEIKCPKGLHGSTDGTDMPDPRRGGRPRGNGVNDIGSEKYEEAVQTSIVKLCKLTREERIRVGKGGTSKTALHTDFIGGSRVPFSGAYERWCEAGWPDDPKVVPELTKIDPFDPSFATPD